MAGILDSIKKLLGGDASSTKTVPPASHVHEQVEDGAVDPHDHVHAPGEEHDHEH